MTVVIFLTRGPYGDLFVPREPLAFEDGPGQFGRLEAAMEGERWVARDPQCHRYELAMGGSPWVRRPGAAPRKWQRSRRSAQH